MYVSDSFVCIFADSKLIWSDRRLRHGPGQAKGGHRLRRSILHRGITGKYILLSRTSFGWF